MANRVITPVSNHLLLALPPKERERALRHCSEVRLTFGDVLHDFDDRIRHVYFLNSGLISLLASIDGSAVAEVGVIGNEGILGLSALLGTTVSPIRALVQGSGTAQRMPVALFIDEVGHSPALRSQLDRFLFSMLVQIAQTAACNLHHKLGPRLARWLLMTQDRVRSDEFYLTQTFLAFMLGVRRSGVTEAANALRKKKLISYSRGNIVILSRRGLEKATCSCYRRVVEQLKSAA